MYDIAAHVVGLVLKEDYGLGEPHCFALLSTLLAFPFLRIQTLTAEGRRLLFAYSLSRTSKLS